MRNAIIDWGIACQALDGAEWSGDAYVIKAFKNKVLVAAIDGLGHGKQAADAACAAVATLMDCPEEGIVTLVRRCHEGLLKTRGVVMSIALFNAVDDSINWVGVGNVYGFLLRSDQHTIPDHESLLLRGGVVGYQLPPLRSSKINVGRGDILIFSTDGIRSGFEKEVNPHESPQQIADNILMNYNRKTDDALVLVARYTGGLS